MSRGSPSPPNEALARPAPPTATFPHQLVDQLAEEISAHNRACLTAHCAVCRSWRGRARQALTYLARNGWLAGGAQPRSGGADG